MNREVLIIGIGNEYRGDDAAGLQAARVLAGRLPLEGKAAEVQVIEQSGEGAALIESWRGATHVIAIDAVQAHAPPGKIFRVDASREPIPADLFHDSTHEFGLAAGVGVARALNALPLQFVVYGIQGENFKPGLGLTDAVRESVTRVVAAIERELQAIAV